MWEIFPHGNNIPNNRNVKEDVASAGVFAKIVRFIEIISVLGRSNRLALCRSQRLKEGIQGNPREPFQHIPNGSQRRVEEDLESQSRPGANRLNACVKQEKYE